MLPSLPDWIPLQSLLIGFPTDPSIWRQSGVPAQHSLVTFVSLVLKHTSITVYVVVDPRHASVAQALFRGFQPRVEILSIPLNDCWLRDTGPIMLPCKTAACFTFNAWGGTCYKDYAKDEKVSSAICSHFGLTATREHMVLEGGAISTDGAGTVLLTRESVLHTNRGIKSAEEVEKVLRRALGAKSIIWLPFGARYDSDTNGHVDNMAVFVGIGRVVLIWAEREEDEEQWKRSMAALDILQDARDAAGNRLEVFKLGIGHVTRTEQESKGVERREGMKRRDGNERVCASYINFVLVNGVMFAPAFGDEHTDENAKHALTKAWRGKVVMVPARELVLGGGGLHCITLGVPE